MDVIKSNEVDINNDDDCKDKMAKKLPLPKNLNRATGYLIFDAK